MKATYGGRWWCWWIGWGDVSRRVEGGEEAVGEVIVGVVEGKEGKEREGKRKKKREDDY